MSDSSSGDPLSPDSLDSSERGPRLRFPKAARLRYASEFRRVKDHGCSFPGRLLVLGVLTEVDPAAAEAGCRVGFVTSRRVGGAVIRNTVRRHLREAVRRSRPLLRPSCWVVVVARHSAGRACGKDLAAEWLKLARRAGILLPTTPPPAP